MNYHPDCMPFTSVKYKCQRKQLLSAGYCSVLLPVKVALVFYADDVHKIYCVVRFASILITHKYGSKLKNTFFYVLLTATDSAMHAGKLHQVSHTGANYLQNSCGFIKTLCLATSQVICILSSQ